MPSVKDSASGASSFGLPNLNGYKLKVNMVADQSNVNESLLSATSFTICPFGSVNTKNKNYLRSPKKDRSTQIEIALTEDDLGSLIARIKNTDPLLANSLSYSDILTNNNLLNHLLPLLLDKLEGIIKSMDNTDLTTANSDVSSAQLTNVIESTGEPGGSANFRISRILGLDLQNEYNSARAFRIPAFARRLRLQAERQSERARRGHLRPGDWICTGLHTIMQSYDVRWQDGSISRRVPSSDLLATFYSIDEHDFCPGDLVHIKQGMSN
ncbi:unnamed protein product [Protopolystoma xenopodis]|uniref:Uncharacterized protein n=1 Tax=Protopolystoma xenopodis TaxID=117903 RepID=A0A3S5ABI2_9PLAT|nr:unnamed protein product [Protopolystoma xenopodis]